MKTQDFIDDARRRTPTARINTGTGKLLEDALQRLATLTAERGEIAELLERLKRWLPVQTDALARMDHNDLDDALAQLTETP